MSKKKSSRPLISFFSLFFRLPNRFMDPLQNFKSELSTAQTLFPKCYDIGSRLLGLAVFRSPSVPPLIVDNWQGPDRRYGHYSKTADHWKTAAVSTTASCFLSMTSRPEKRLVDSKSAGFWRKREKNGDIPTFSVWQTQLKSLSMALEEFTGWCVLVFVLIQFVLSSERKVGSTVFLFPVDFWFHIKCISHYFCFVFSVISVSFGFLFGFSYSM